MKQILSFIFVLIVISCKSQKALVFKQIPLPKPPATDISIIKWNTTQSGFNELSPNEQEFFYWVNYSRENPLDFFEKVVLPLTTTYPQLKGYNLNTLGSDLKSTPPLSLFKLNQVLLKMANYHSTDITSSNSNPSHNSTNGDSFIDRFKKFGLRNCGGENISYGGGDTDPLFMLVLLYLDINVPELGHRKALLNPSFENTGISIKKYKNGNTFLVQDFACAQK